MVEGQGGQPLPEIPHLRHSDPLRRHHRRMGTHPGTARKVETPPHELHQPPARDPARHAHHLPARQPRRLSRPRPAAPFRQHHRAQGLHPHQRVAAFLRAARRRVRPRHLVDEVAGQDRRRGLLGAHVVQPHLQPAAPQTGAALLLRLAEDQTEGQGLGLLHQRLREAPGGDRRTERLQRCDLRAHPPGRQAHDRQHALPQLGRLGRIAHRPGRGLRRQLGDPPLRPRK